MTRIRVSLAGDSSATARVPARLLPLPRRGGVIVYTVAAIVALVAICSLAVDLGRVQLAKTELQRAVDAATRAAAAYLPLDTVGAKNAAISVAAQNSIDGTPLVLFVSDIEVGNWDSASNSFSAAGVANAVRVTARRTAARGTAIARPFAQILGLAAQDLTVTQTTYTRPGTPGGIVGHSGIFVKNNLFAAGYDSRNTTNPTPGNSTDHGALGSNSVIKAKNNSALRGDAILGPSGSVSGLSVTGTSLQRAADLTRPAAPAWNPGKNPGNIAPDYSVSSNVTLPGGTYWFTSLTVSGTLNFGGPATIYLNGDGDISGTLSAYQDRPANLQIYVIGARTFGDHNGNGIDITADIEAPDSAFYANNNATFRGRMFFDTITAKNNADLYYDESFGDAQGSALIATVAH
jgi:Flp pilus assembly protein TadG